MQRAYIRNPIAKVSSWNIQLSAPGIDDAATIRYVDGYHNRLITFDGIDFFVHLISAR